MRPLVGAGFAMAILGSCLWAQNVISANSGLVHYTEGKVLLAGKPLESRPAQFPQIKENQELRTEEGRAEVLLTPGVFLRMAENSAIRMVSTRLTDSRVEFLSGSVLIESADALKENSVTIHFGDSVIRPRKAGLYRLDSEPPLFRVLDGEAGVEAGGKALVLKEGRMLHVEGEMAVEKFDPKVGDAFARWSLRRAEYISLANISAAKMMSDSGRNWTSSLWGWNPYFQMWTFIPYSGSFYSPYGYRYWSPGAVYMVYNPPVFSRGFDGGGRYNADLGYRTMPRTPAGYSGTIAATAPSRTAPTTAASGAASAPVSRESGRGGGRRQ
ncbi:MAG: hypothetical protein IT158_16070 [Bryobacterales bacterium]|nr:hypothetical protein [Bryobacterales bacterium]